MEISIIYSKKWSCATADYEFSLVTGRDWGMVDLEARL